MLKIFRDLRHRNYGVWALEKCFKKSKSYVVLLLKLSSYNKKRLKKSITVIIKKKTKI